MLWARIAFAALGGVAMLTSLLALQETSDQAGRREYVWKGYFARRAAFTERGWRYRNVSLGCAILSILLLLLGPVV
jgi:hypothetical protein